MNEMLNRINGALDTSDAIDAFKAGFITVWSSLILLPPLPRKTNWTTQQEAEEHAETLTLSEWHTWSQSAIDALDQQEG